MYGWIVDGISSLFEPVSDQNHTEWPGNSAQVPGRSAVTPGTRPESHARPAKRNYQRLVYGFALCIIQLNRTLIDYALLRRICMSQRYYQPNIG